MKRCVFDVSTRRWRRRSTPLVQALLLLCAAPQLPTSDSTRKDRDLSTAPGAWARRGAPRVFAFEAKWLALLTQKAPTKRSTGARRAREVYIFVATDAARALYGDAVVATPRHPRRFIFSTPGGGCAVGGRPGRAARVARRRLRDAATPQNRARVMLPAGCHTRSVARTPRCLGAACTALGRVPRALASRVVIFATSTPRGRCAPVAGASAAGGRDTALLALLAPGHSARCAVGASLRGERTILSWYS